MKRILLIGGGGYVGTQLAELLLNNYFVRVYDLFLYGNNIEPHKNLEIIKGDIRDTSKMENAAKDCDIAIHLACISNDPSFDLNPELGKSINFSCFEDIVKISKNNGIKKFIYASSSSVYGIKDEENVDEKCSLEPITDYSKFKVKCEEILLKYKSTSFITTIIRPATVCGYSKRQRFDLVVNILTNHGYNNGEIKVFGGAQLRPNINIKDMCNAYLHVINQEDNLINGEIFNVGFENYSVNYLADIVARSLGGNVKVINVPTDDNRSYHISSKKFIEKLNFKTKFTIEDSVRELINKFENKSFKDSLQNEMYFNIKRMQNINLK